MNLLRKMILLRTIALVALCSQPSFAQRDNPFLLRENSQRLDREAVAFLEAASVLTESAAEATVGIYYGRRRLCYGTVVDDGRLVTKLSDIVGFTGPLMALGSDGQARRLEVLAQVPEHDLAIMAYSGVALPAVSLASDVSDLQAGDLVFMARPDGVVASGGTVSVLPRSLLPQDQGFLGVGGDRRAFGKGILIRTVKAGSAADMAGIRVGDRLLKVENTQIDGFDELSVVLKRRKPGDEVKVELERAGKTFAVNAVLTAYDEIRMPASERFQRMEAMGAELSRRRDGFSNVIQTDLDLRGIDMGAPVVNLDGEVIGIGLSRASRIKCYVLPIEIVAEALAQLDS